MKVTCNTPETITFTVEMTRSEARMLLNMMVLNIAIPKLMIQHHNGYEYTEAEDDIGEMMEEFSTALSKIL